MKQPHIAFFNRAFYPEVSATGQLLTELAEGLAKEYGCRVSVVAGLPQGELHHDWTPSRRLGFCYEEWHGTIRVLRARSTSFPKRIFAGRVANYLTYFVSACIAGLKLGRPDVVIALTDPPVIGLAAWLSARRFGAKLLISYRDLFPEVARLLDRKPPRFVEWTLHQVNHILIRQADRIIALGEAMKGKLIHEKKAPENKTVIIRDWADGAAITPGPKHNRFSAANGLTDSFVVMHSGNIGASQNLEFLVEAADLLKDKPRLLFAFVGDGVMKPSLQNRAKQLGLKNILFFPYQPKESLSDLFASADCFVVSLKPGLAGYIMPSKLYGILAAGRPYVAAVEDWCDVARITREHGCGLLAKQQDAQSLADKILELYLDQELVRRMGGRAAAAGRLFDREHGIKAYYELCLDVTSGFPASERVV